jgi:magnesium transporter
MIRHLCTLDTTNHACRTGVPPADVHTALQSSDHVVWVDIEGPTHEDLTFLADEFHFHPLALEDCTHPHQRPKVDSYDGYFFMVLYATEYHVEENRLRTAEIDVFWGPNYVVTVHKEPVADLKQAEDRWRASGPFAAQGASFLAYLIVDSVVDNYFPVIEAINEQIEDIEERIFLDFDQKSIQRIFALKKQLIHLRKSVVPLRDVFVMLIRREVGLVSAPTLPYLQDVYDHLIRVADAIDTYRDLISGTIDAYLSTVANRTNEVMRRLTILTTMLMTPTLVAGVYGMNFEFMPELHWVNGYPLALLTMLVMVIAELLIFKRLDYF